MRIALILAALVLGAFAAIVFEAANAAASINNRAEHARLTDSLDVRDALLAQAEDIVRNDPLHRTLWHGGAAEGASWVKFLEAVASRSPDSRTLLLRASRDYAQKAVAEGPISAPTWLRLALLDEAGIPNSRCARAQCLIYSYQAAPIAKQELACARADAAIRAGLITRPDDARVRQLSLSEVTFRQLPTCIPSAPAPFLFTAMLQARREESRKKK